jgi:hypothetical protein
MIEDEDTPKIVRQQTTLSQDSPAKNFGVVGQYISRIIEDREENPDKYPDSEEEERLEREGP